MHGQSERPARPSQPGGYHFAGIHEPYRIEYYLHSPAGSTARRAKHLAGNRPLLHLPPPLSKRPGYQDRRVVRILPPSGVISPFLLRTLLERGYTRGITEQEVGEQRGEEREGDGWSGKGGEGEQRGAGLEDDLAEVAKGVSGSLWVDRLREHDR